MIVSKKKIVVYLLYLLAMIIFYLVATAIVNTDVYLLGLGLAALASTINRFHFGKRKIERNLYDDALAQDK